ncbi:MAG: hypothetical protein HZB13_05400 [Acidobacteria bacterium]|nr:hypothetical protein [Acidobacteriota bacterium]
MQNLREAEYNRRATNETFTRIRTHSAEAWHLKAMRLLHFWCGRLRFLWLAALFTAVMILVVLGLCRTLPALGVPRRAALSIPLAALPLGYFIVSNFAHYPVPLAWMLLPLPGAEFRHWNGRKAMEV